MYYCQGKKKKNTFTSFTFADDVVPKEFHYFTNVQIPMVAIGLPKSVYFGLLTFTFILSC